MPDENQTGGEVAAETATAPVEKTSAELKAEAQALLAAAEQKELAEIASAQTGEEAEATETSGIILKARLDVLEKRVNAISDAFGGKY